MKISSATMDHLLIHCGVAYNCGHLFFLWDFHSVMPKTVVGLHLVRKIGLENRNPLSGIYFLYAYVGNMAGEEQLYF